MKKIFKVDTNREAFNLIKEHLLKQGKACKSPTGLISCHYDGSQSGHPELAGLKCAIGALMTNEAIQDFGASQGDVENIIEEAVDNGYEKSFISKLLLFRLQEIHDYSHPSEWEKRLKVLEREYF